MRLLIVSNSGLPALNLAIHGYDVVTTSATSITEAVAISRADPHDLALLDMTAEAGDGLDFIHQLRTSQNDMLVLAVTGSRATDRISALAVGADDAIPALVDPAELRACIAALLKHRRNVGGSDVSMGNVSLSRIRQDALIRGRPVKLTGREYALLEYLVSRKGRVISKDALLARLSDGADEPETKIVDVLVCKLRRKLQRAGADILINTVWEQGYTISDQQNAGQHLTSDQGHQKAA